MPRLIYVCVICGKTHDNIKSCEFCELSCEFEMDFKRLYDDVIESSISSSNYISYVEKTQKRLTKYMQDRETFQWEL